MALSDLHPISLSLSVSLCLCVSVSVSVCLSLSLSLSLSHTHTHTHTTTLETEKSLVPSCLFHFISTSHGRGMTHQRQQSQNSILLSQCPFPPQTCLLLSLQTGSLLLPWCQSTHLIADSLLKGELEKNPSIPSSLTILGAPSVIHSTRNQARGFLPEEFHLLLGFHIPLRWQ